MRNRILLLAVLALALTALGPATASSVAAEPKVGASPRLKAFGSCTGLVRYGNRYRKRYVGSGSGSQPVPAEGAPRGDGAPATGEPTTGGGAGDDYSNTNVQEAGVDEPDIVKSDGKRILALAGGKLHAVDARSVVPRLMGSLALGEGYDHQLLIRGDRALVAWQESPQFGPEPVRAASSVPGYWNPVTVLAEVDIGDPAAMRVVRTLKVDGSFLSARLTGGTARVVISAAPRALTLPPVADRPRAAGGSPAAERRRRALRRIANWIPRYVLKNRRTRRTTTRPLVGCRAVRRASEFSGLDMLTVLTIDLDTGLAPIDSDALMTAADTVYASTDGLYVATQRWLSSFDQAEDESVPAGMTTSIHRFDVSSQDRTAYRASGEVPGFLLSQFSLSEYRGVLRVASTDQPSWWGWDQGEESQSFVTTLEERSGNLEQIGQVGELGRGEQIYAVRFIGDTGYVVTFRQTDPLYTLDLSEPQRPKVLGELKILGYSAYLHPAGRDLLIGVGQDATEAGRQLGSQISLFDVSDLRYPVRLARRTIAADSSSEVEYDHHAFLYWPATGLTVLPVEEYAFEREDEDPFVGAIGFRIGRARGIEETGRITHNAGPVPARVRRSLVVGNRLFTLSDRGVKASDLQTLTDAGWVPFS